MSRIFILLAVALAACGGAGKSTSATPADTKAKAHEPISVRIEWPDGKPYKYGARWSMSVVCAPGESFQVETNGHVAGGRWMVRWPDGCSTDFLEVDLSVFVTWMGCDSPPRFKQTIQEGNEIAVRIPECDDDVEASAQ